MTSQPHRLAWATALLYRAQGILPLAIALLLALIVASALLLALNASPIEAYSSMLRGAFGTENATAETLVKAIPILFVAIGICIAFRGGVTNIGGEGQMIAGAVAGITVTLALAQAPGIVIIPAAIVAAFVVGALYGGIAGFLKAYFNVNEILSTIMLNQVAVQLMNFLLNGPLLDPAEAGANHIPKTARIAEAAELPRLSFVLPEAVAGIFGTADLFGRTRLHYGLVLAVLLAALTYILLWRTIIGYRIRAVGESERAARYAGIHVKRYMVLSMMLAGGFAGLAGIVQVLGLQYRLQTDGSPAGFTGSAGFNGIVAALFGGLNPLGAVPAAIFFGGLLVGAQKMQRDLEVSASLITAINGLIVVFVVSSQIFTRRITRRQQAALRERPPIPEEASA
ncbi:MAG: ABC transporter permease [Anaerolineae bacterium]|jgi:simple sugar transport system permease protein|nr:ABC transporter permease [Anaerolineae bacterium]